MSGRDKLSRVKYELRYLGYSKGPPDRNMAVDHFLLERVAARRCPPVLRFYSFEPPSVTLGYHQKRVPSALAGYPAVRRPTGGRAVLHRGDLVYSIAASVDHPLLGGGVTETFKKIAVIVLEGLRLAGLPAELSRGKPRGERELCFESTARYEIVVRGKKVVGAAQVRKGGAFLEQASVQTGIPPEKLALNMAEAFRRRGFHLQKLPLSSEEKKEVEELLPLYPVLQP